MDIRSFRDLIVWQRAVEFAAESYRLTLCFPTEERYGITSQLRRAAVSVSSNIAEGHARQGGEFPYFLSVARGSLAECESLVEVSIVLGYSQRDRVRPFDSLANELERMLSTLEAKVRLAHGTRS